MVAVTKDATKIQMADKRRERLSQELRANLRKRKERASPDVHADLPDQAAQLDTGSAPADVKSDNDDTT